MYIIIKIIILVRRNFYLFSLYQNCVIYYFLSIQDVFLLINIIFQFKSKTFKDFVVCNEKDNNVNHSWIKIDLNSKSTSLSNENMNIDRELEKKYNSLLEENNKLKEQLSQKEKYYNSEINKLKMELEKYKQENMNSRNNSNINEIFLLKSENNYLKKRLYEFTDEINILKLQIQNNNIKSENQLKPDDLLTIRFISNDQAILNYSIKCLKTNTFAEVEEQLYKIYDNYRNTNNTFFVRGKQILRFKKIEENGIKNGDDILLFQLLDKIIRNN